MLKLRTIFYIHFVLLLFSGCKKDPSVWNITNLNNNRIGVMGHGGSGTLYRYPMNSMQSLNEVLKLEVDGTEMDVELTKDNVLVLYHHLNLEDGTNLSGKIREKNWDEIKNCKYKLPLFNKAHLIRASDFFDQRTDLKKFIFTFDTKVQVGDDIDRQLGFADALWALIIKYELEENCFIESYNGSFLKIMETKSSKLKLFVHANDYKTALSMNSFVKLFGITMDREKITKKEIEEAHKNNLKVTLYNLDTENENLKGIAMNPDYMQSDKCDHLINALK
ncbi:MAG: hypothetical protein IT236_16935 [Bacteroidia bacterium]|nr:hypothetical protein [Bacteroidia bacterium]